MNQSTDKGCNRQFYYGTNEYPDYRCIDGNLWDDDDCDEKGNLHEPTESIACPFCRPEEYDDKDYLEAMKAVETDTIKEKKIQQKLEGKVW